MATKPTRVSAVCHLRAALSSTNVAREPTEPKREVQPEKLGNVPRAPTVAPPEDPVKARIIPRDSKVFIVKADEEDPTKPQAEGFENYLAAASRKKGVQLLISDKSLADFEIRDSASSHGAGLAKKFLLGDFRKSTTASIEVINLKTGVVAFADSSDRSSANRGLRSSS